jgi:DNA-binding transcriptional MerR regulator
VDELTLVADIARLKLAVAHLGTSTDNIRDIISRLDRSDAINSEKIRYLEQTAQAVKDDISKLDTSLQAIQYKLAEVRGLVDSDKVEVTLGGCKCESGPVE